MYKYNLKSLWRNSVSSFYLSLYNQSFPSHVEICLFQLSPFASLLGIINPVFVCFCLEVIISACPGSFNFSFLHPGLPFRCSPCPSVTVHSNYMHCPSPFRFCQRFVYFGTTLQINRFVVVYGCQTQVHVVFLYFLYDVSYGYILYIVFWNLLVPNFGRVRISWVICLLCQIIDSRGMRTT